MKYVNLKSGELIDSHKIDAACFYIIEGSLNILVDKKQVKSLSQGNGFGQMDILWKSPKKNVEMEILEDSILWYIKTETFQKILQEINGLTFGSKRKFMDQCKLFGKGS